MDLEGIKFGRGPRELGGAVDLINHYKLWPHHEFFCKRSLPLSISETHYLQNVVGDTEIRKGEGMELDQLFQHTSYMGDRHAQIHPFDLDILREAFQMRETTLIDLPSAEKGIPTVVSKSKGDSKDEKKHKKRQGRDKDKGHKKHKSRHKDSNKDKDKEKNRNELHDFGPEQLQRQQDKKRRHDGSEVLSGIQRHQKSEVNLAMHKNLKISEMGKLKIAR
uniref:Putative mediator of RNA polymerase II transcription subunit 19a n=1 Tax=Davidia involucrata TaxID=16924 RepID=A0A5B7BQ16_DAVIN